MKEKEESIYEFRMNIFKSAAVGAIAATIIGITTAIGVQASVQRPAPGETRLKITCDLIQKNVEEGTNENTLHPRSFYYKVINRINSNMDRLSTPPPMEYLHVTLSSEVLSVNSSGTDVVLAQFPSSGDLTSFGLTPSVIKTIAIPNDIQDWPTTALNGCTNLEKITVYGPESCDGTIILDLGHGLRNFAQLTSIQLPSTVIKIGRDGVWVWAGRDSLTVFPKQLKSIVLSSQLQDLGGRTFLDNQVLSSIDFSRCKKLKTTGIDTFFYDENLTGFDFSLCDSLTTLGWASFQGTSLSTIVLPPSVISIEARVFYCVTPIKTLIWKGRSSRPDGINSTAFSATATLADLVSAGTITEIFVP